MTALTSATNSRHATPLVDDADRWLLSGALCCGTVVLAPIGLVLIVVALRKLTRARTAGEVVRPAAVTIFGVFSMVDASINFVGWSMDLFSHNTHLLQTMSRGFGRFIDGGYYFDYNSTWLGGVFDDGEKSMASMAVFMIFPARIIAAWAFIKLKRRGHRWMVLTSWCYVLLWTAYMANLLQNFPNRLGNTLFGVTGWWVFDIFYMTPFLTLPWLYALDRRRWNR
ncbi:hypothetical protein [Mycobacterium sp. 94-17]|uniref:hypothetical protein n=1 Tax=Mycobacterium sp. 94-17 TaxID=2986147 RepID=UPI002D1F2A88|nr:hypothetical protein [Mycobacterium sp. 94-17]MEB4210613.1 hypothetical protein [Mycobacterium sp. 94-17]